MYIFFILKELDVVDRRRARLFPKQEIRRIFDAMLGRVGGVGEPS